MPKVIYDTSKGLYQTSGSGFAGASSIQTLSADAQTIQTGTLVARVDAGGSSRTGTKLQAGTEIGQICILVNVSDAAEDIDFADAATSLFAGVSNANRTVGQNVGVMLVWTGSLWVPTSQSLS